MGRAIFLRHNESCYLFDVCIFLKTLFLHTQEKHTDVTTELWKYLTTFKGLMEAVTLNPDNLKYAAVIITTHKKCIVAITTTSSHVRLPEKLELSLIRQIHGPKPENISPIPSWHLLSCKMNFNAHNYFLTIIIIRKKKTKKTTPLPED